MIVNSKKVARLKWIMVWIFGNPEAKHRSEKEKEDKCRLVVRPL